MSNKFQQTVSRLPLLAGVMGVLLLAAACGGSSGTAAPKSSSGATVPAKSGAVAVKTADTDAGKVLVDANGRTMYAFAADTKGHSACTGSCLTYWPPVPAGAKAPTAASGVTATFGVLNRSDGTAQLTVDGWPMYTYIGDTKPGATTGQGKDLSGGLWWVVAPSGKWITDKGSTGNATKDTTGGTGGYGY